MRYWLTIICMYAFTIVTAQDLAADLKRSNNYLGSLKSFKFDVSVDIYEDLKNVKPYMNMSGQLIKSGNAFFNNIDNREFYTDYLNFVIVNHENKEISLHKGRKKDIESQVAQYNIIGTLDSFNTFSDSIIYNGAYKGVKQYTILQKGALIHTTVVVLDSATCVLKQITYYYDIEEMETNNKVIAYYTLHEKLGRDDLSKLVLSNYIELVGNTPKPAVRLTGYSLKN